jgi:hypothetical protein
MSQHELDEALAKIRSEQPSDEVVKTAAGRVFRNLFDSTFIAAEPTGKIRGCADVRALFPAYLNRTLSAARTALLEDHVLGCVDCRHALHEARSGTAAVRPIPINRVPRKRVPMLVWAAAAALLVGVGLGLTGRLPGQNTLNATVASFQGSLYKVTDIGVSLVEAGEILKNTDELRTAKGSHALLRLAGGAMVEIAERSDVTLSSGWRGTSLNLKRGQMIVDTHNQSQKAVYVNSGEMTIPVTSGVVAFDHGTKDSRVAVAKGSVEVSAGGVKRQVSAGQQYGGGQLQLVNLPITSEFAWSQNSAAYGDLLNQLSGLQKDIQALPSPGLRYTSNLPQYLPADTFLYAAIPNVGGTITEAKKLFDSRLAESAALRQWWQQKAIAKNGEFDHIIDQISSISGYLGDEIVVAVGGDVAGSQAGPVFMAEIKQPGLAEYLQTNLPANAQIQIVSASSPAAAGNKLLIELDNNILVASPSAIQLQRVEEVLHKAAPGNFTSTPFFARINKVYQNGAGSFLAANLEQITAKSVASSKASVPLGLENVQYLVLERKGDDGEMRASVSFAGDRQGVASWLGAPSPAGSLDFVSPDANFATSVVMKSPKVMMQELLTMASGSSPDFTQELNKFQSQAGVSLLDDVAAPLGNDVTLAMEGPVTPVLAIEVYDPNHLQQTLTAFINKFNQLASAKAGHLTLASTEVNGRTFFSISNSNANALAAHYTFVDGYLVASTSEGSVLNAISNKQAGHTLASSDNFRAKLPSDGYSNFSAMVYSNLGSLGDLAKQFNSSGNKQQKALSGLIANSGPSLICVYGDTDRIVAATKSSFLGFDLGTLIGIQQGKPLNTMIASAPMSAGKGIIN